MQTHIQKFFAVAIACASVVAGCTPTPPPKYSHSLAVTYGELLVFHEREKMVRMEPDSLYKDKLKDFFATRKMDEEGFKNQITLLSHDDVAWRAFLGEATAAVDSIKAAKPAYLPENFSPCLS